MLFDIWKHFYPNDKEIEEIDEKWCKNKKNIIN